MDPLPVIHFLSPRRLQATRRRRSRRDSPEPPASFLSVTARIWRWAAQADSRSICWWAWPRRPRHPSARSDQTSSLFTLLLFSETRPELNTDSESQLVLLSRSLYAIFIYEANKKRERQVSTPFCRLFWDLSLFQEWSSWNSFR